MSVFSNEYEDMLTQAMAKCSKKPLDFVLNAFPWGEGELKDKYPEPWQIDTLKDIGDGLISMQEAVKIATASGHGIGKSALVAWLILWAMSTFPETKGVVTANNETQLRTKTWAEVKKWHNLLICKHWFEVTATSIYSSNPKYSKTWRIDAIAWSKSNPDAFAGLHNQGKRILVIFDEASQIWDRIWEVTEGALTDSDTQIVWACFGNPTQNIGNFYECFHKNREYWNTRQIDSRSVSFTNKAQIAKWLEQYGEDSDFFRVRVRGVFPAQSSSQLINEAVISNAIKAQSFDDTYLPLLMAVDVARYGDDSSHIRFRRGRNSRDFPNFTYAKMDTNTLARECKKIIDQYNPDAVFIDGGGVGGGVVDNLRAWNYDDVVIEVNFAEVTSLERPERYINKRAEMYDDAKEWLEKGGTIENDEKLKSDLMNIQYFYKGNKMQLMSKEDMKALGLPSPDKSDALAMTFYCQVKKKEKGNSGRGSSSSYQQQSESYDWSK